MPPPFGPLSPTAPVAGAGAPPGQPPFGASPLTMPVPNHGNEAAAKAAVRAAVGLLQGSLKDAGIGTPLAEAIMKSIDTLAKQVKEGDTTQGAKEAELQRFMMQQRQQAPLLATLAALKAGGGPGAGASPPPPAPGAAGAPMTPQG